MNNELRHYNIKGSKWGQRRFQNKDGSLTPAGRIRYGVGKDKKNGVSALDKLKIKRKAAANKKDQPVKKPTAQKTPAQIKKEQEAAREAKRKAVLASRSAKEIYNNAHLFTNEELIAAKERLILERDIANLEPKTISKGEARAQKIKKAGETVNGLMDTGIKLWNNTARLYNSLTDSGKENPLPIIKDKGDRSTTKSSKAEAEAIRKDKVQAAKDSAEADRILAREKKINAQRTAKSNAEKRQAEDKAAKEARKEEKQAKKDAKKFNKYTDDSGPWKGTVEGVGRSRAERFFNDDDDFVEGIFREMSASSVAKSPQRAIGENYIMALLEDKRR